MIRKPFIVLISLVIVAAIALWAQQLGQPGNLLISCNAVTATGACTAFSVNAPQAATYTWQTSETGSPASVTVNLEGSLDGSTWSTLDTTSSTTGSFQTKAGAPVRQIRCNLATLTGGTNPTVTCQMTVSTSSSGGTGAGTVTSVGLTQTGTNFTITNSPITTSGNINIALSPLATADQGFFVSNGLFNFPAAVGNVAVVANPQEVRAAQFTLPIGFTISRITTVPAATVASSTITCGIYSADKNTKLIDSGTFNGGNAAAQTLTITPVTLRPGVYWFAQSASTQTTLTVPQAGPSSTTNVLLLNNQTNKKFGLAANAATSGVLPSALGAITALAYAPISCVFEP